MKVAPARFVGVALVCCAGVASAQHGAAPGASAQGCQPAWLPTFGALPGVNARINAMAVFDDGSGPALYCGGDFTQAGGLAVSGIACWDGAWSYVGSGANDPFEEVNDLAVHDDGSGPKLYAC